MNIEERGLVVSNEKQFSYRTVEGNLGLRVSATGIPEAVGDKAVLRAMDHDYGLTPEDVENYVDLLEAHNDSHSRRREGGLSRPRACRVRRGRRHPPSRRVLREGGRSRHGHHGPGAPMGRDLRNVRQVLCVGGIFLHCHGEERENIVRRTFDNPGISLLPLNDPDIWFDEDYILYAMGVLAQHFPEEVLSYMKEHVIKK